MKKIAITTAILIAGTILANAQTNSQGQNPRVMMRRPIMQQNVASTTRVMPVQGGEWTGGGMPQGLTTGDANTDAQLKALTIEMQAKINAIRDEYQAKISVIIGTRKLINGTSTRPMIPTNGDENRQNVGSSTDGNIPPMPRRSSEVKGVSTEINGQDIGMNVGYRVMNFFRGMFGGK